MTYDVAAARAERGIGEVFDFTLDGVAWRLPHPRDVTAMFRTWSVADYITHFSDLVERVDGEPEVFPTASLSSADLDALVEAWIGASVGESSPPSTS